MAGRWENWVHWRELRGACPICGEPAHVGMSERNGKFFWLHDDCPGVPEFYRTHGVWKLEEIPFEEFKRLCEEAKALGAKWDRTKKVWYRPPMRLGAAAHLSRRP